MHACDCREIHPLKKLVVTGGPGAGKTAAIEIVRAEIPPCCQLERRTTSTIAPVATARSS